VQVCVCVVCVCFSYVAVVCGVYVCTCNKFAQRQPTVDVAGGLARKSRSEPSPVGPQARKVCVCVCVVCGVRVCVCVCVFQLFVSLLSPLMCPVW
jgi:hypothetical protein